MKSQRLQVLTLYVQSGLHFSRERQSVDIFTAYSMAIHADKNNLQLKNTSLEERLIDD